MVVVVVLIAWLLFGLAGAVVMIRRGHSPAIWLSLSFFGPLVIFLVISALDEEAPIAAKAEGIAGSPGAGPVDVLIGLDGSPASHAALEEVVRIFGDRLGRVTVATVLDYDVDQLPGNPAPRQDAADLLAGAVGAVHALADLTPEQAVLTGKPADALVDYARTTGAHLVIAGTRGAGAHLVLGSTAKSLASQAEVPVLLVPSAPDAST